jgi:hypothetical protein
MDSTSLNKDDILKKLIPKINQLRNDEINNQDNNLLRDRYSEIYIDWSFILYDFIEINLVKIINLQTIENNIINYDRIKDSYLNNNLDDLLNDILSKTNLGNYNNIIENSPELFCFINSEKFIDSKNKLNSKIKKMLSEEFINLQKKHNSKFINILSEEFTPPKI